VGGKATLFLVMGFSLLFLVVARNFGSITTRAVDNVVDYHDETIAHNIAVSGANLAANQVFLDNKWDEGYDKINFMDGTLEVDVDVIDAFQDIRKITSKGTYRNITHQVQVTLSPSRFSKFAYYSVNEGSSIWWTENDTVWGPFHTQDYMRVYRHPVFYGKATTKRKLIYYSSKKKDYPRLYGGFEQGVDLPLPSDGLSPIESIAEDNGYKFTGEDTVYITFANDSIKYKFEYNDPYNTVEASALAPNGVIFAKNAVVRLKGSVKGQYTVAVSGSSGAGKVYLDNDIVYNKDPREFPTSTDLLGIVARNHVLITDNTANQSDINIHASIYSETDGFGAENYNTRPASGNINLLGGIIQNTRQAVGTFSSYGTSHGFNKRYKYDTRLLKSYPPAFPGTGKYEIVSWLE
jgi:hypothetical protein